MSRAPFDKPIVTLHGHLAGGQRAVQAIARAAQQMAEAFAPVKAHLLEQAAVKRRARARLITEMYGYPEPGPAWLRTTSRRRRAGSRRLKKLAHRGDARLWCW